MDKYTQKLIEEGFISLLLAWLSYLFFYQNLLLYKWQKGLPLPSKTPFVIAGILIGAGYFLYKWSRLKEKFKENKSFRFLAR